MPPPPPPLATSAAQLGHRRQRTRADLVRCVRHIFWLGCWGGWLTLRWPRTAGGHYSGNVSRKDTGASDGRGFGHVGFVVDDVYAMCDVLRPFGFGFQKEPDGGNMKGLAFALDPDGYWVEILKREK